MSERLIGFSTGCLYRVNQYLIKKLEMFRQAGAQVLELSFATPLELFSFPLMNEELIEIIKGFTFVTIHAPWKDILYYPIDEEDNRTPKALKKLCNIARQIFAKGVIMHPNVVSDLAALNMHVLSIFLENMDERKQVGKNPELFEALIKYNYSFSYVLDLQHAFTVDPSMKMVDGFIRLWGNKLKYVHISGQTESSNHCPLHIADNKKKIIKGLKMVPVDIPIILEGVITEEVPKTLKKELDFIKSNL